MSSEERTQTAQSGGTWLRSWSGIGALFLMFAAALLLTACGGEEGAEGEGGGDEVAFSDFDTDDSGGITENEFAEGIYEDFDTDDDGVVGEEEFNTAVEESPFIEGTDGFAEFGEFDLNDDNEITEDEFTEAFTETEVYDDFDADDDGMINNEEFTDAV